MGGGSGGGEWGGRLCRIQISSFCPQQKTMPFLMLCFRCYDFFPSPFFDVVRGYHITTLDFIKWHSQQPLPASSQLVVTFQWTLKHLIQPILCYTFFCVYLHRFQVNIILTRHTPRDHSISCPSYYLERTIKKPFTGSIVLRYVTSSRDPSKLCGQMFPSRPGLQRSHLKTIYF